VRSGITIFDPQLERRLAHRRVIELDGAIGQRYPAQMHLGTASSGFTPVAEERRQDFHLAVATAQHREVGVLDADLGNADIAGNERTELRHDDDALGAEFFLARPALGRLDAHPEDFDRREADPDFPDLAVRPQRFLDLGLERLGGDMQAAQRKQRQHDQGDDDPQQPAAGSGGNHEGLPKTEAPLFSRLPCRCQSKIRHRHSAVSAPERACENL
jgi:hypothetical protein